MNHATHNKIVSFIWSIADDCLRDVFVRGKYRDVILPMFVLRRIDCLLEDSKEAVLDEMRFQKEEADMVELDPAGLRDASGQVFYNTSKFTLKSLLGNPSQLQTNFNIYQYLLENDYLEAIVQMPNNIFYNTGITTYIWVLSNNKQESRLGKVQLIDASQLYEKLRKNLGDKNCAFTTPHIEQITKAYLDMIDNGKDAVDGLKSQVFDNKDFGYWKITVERPLRKSAQWDLEKIQSLRFDKVLSEEMEWLYQAYGDQVYSGGFLTAEKESIQKHFENEGVELKAAQLKKLLNTKLWLNNRHLLAAAEQLVEHFDDTIHNNFNTFRDDAKAACKKLKIKLSATELKKILDAVSWRDPEAEPVVKGSIALDYNQHGEGYSTQAERALLYGAHASESGTYFTYEPDSELRDTENVPMNYLPDGAPAAETIETYLKREVLPHVSDAWISEESTKTGYEISFNKYFYVHQPLRDLAEVVQEIRDLENETEGLLEKILNF